MTAPLAPVPAPPLETPWTDRERSICRMRPRGRQDFVPFARGEGGSPHSAFPVLARPNRPPVSLKAGA
jgi:hypothetical protein